MTTAELPSPAERVARGRAARASTPRSSHAQLDLAAKRDPVGLLEAQGRSRVPALLPIRYGRMLASPLAFLRGAAAVMAHDLAATPRSGLGAQLCGDAHLANFGGFASPERDLVFDLNDFDETLPGPFEWDVKRLAASFELAARQREFRKADRRRAVLGVVRAYREAMRQFAAMGDVDVWYAMLDARAAVRELRHKHDRKLAKTLARASANAHDNDRMRALARLTRVVEGEPRIVSEPPLIVPVSDLVDNPTSVERGIEEVLAGYRKTLTRDRQRLLNGFRYVDLARKVVGIGSVGTRCWLALMLGRDDRDPLFLQVKEADASTLEPYLGRSAYETHGERVVEGQRLMQAASDIFLGWAHVAAVGDEEVRDVYVRQLWDWKSGLDVETVVPQALAAYAGACGWTLARAHARSGDRIAIASYLGAGDRFDHAVADFAAAYADVTERDHRALREAVDAKRLPASEGV